MTVKHEEIFSFLVKNNAVIKRTQKIQKYIKKKKNQKQKTYLKAVWNAQLQKVSQESNEQARVAIEEKKICMQLVGESKADMNLYSFQTKLVTSPKIS